MTPLGSRCIIAYTKRMIGYIEGPVRKCEEKSVIIDAGGLGYRVYVTGATRAGADRKPLLSLFTHLAVREDAMDLYGFETEEELGMFEALMSVSKIGPKSAMHILSNTGVELLRRAIGGNDPSYLTKVSGVGKKTAEKIVLELKDKFIPGPGDTHEHTTAEGEALDALEALGYSIRDTREVVRAIARTASDPKEIVRKALQTLGR